jgi:hypothetical protein
MKLGIYVTQKNYVTKYGILVIPGIILSVYRLNSVF